MIIAHSHMQMQIYVMSNCIINLHIRFVKSEIERFCKRYWHGMMARRKFNIQQEKSKKKRIKMKEIMKERMKEVSV